MPSDAYALQHADAPEGAVPADRSQQRAHVCVRADGLRLRPHRQRAARHRVRRAVPAAAAHLWGRACHLRAQHHRRRRQDQRAGGGGISRPTAERGDPQGHDQDREAVPRGHRGARRAAADGRAARDRAHRRDARAVRGAGGQGPRLRGDGPRAVRRGLHAGLRAARQSLAGGDGGRRARRCGALQEGAHGLRAVEAVEARRAGVAVALRASRRRAGPAGTSSARRWPIAGCGRNRS